MFKSNWTNFGFVCLFPVEMGERVVGLDLDPSGGPFAFVAFHLSEPPSELAANLYYPTGLQDSGSDEGGWLLLLQVAPLLYVNI